MTQCEMIMDYICKNGSITSAEAMYNFGCSRLAARIADLERMGKRFTRTTVTDKNRYGKKVTFVRYALKG